MLKVYNTVSTSTIRKHFILRLDTQMGAAPPPFSGFLLHEYILNNLKKREGGKRKKMFIDKFTQKLEGGGRI